MFSNLCSADFSDAKQKGWEPRQAANIAAFCSHPCIFFPQVFVMKMLNKFAYMNISPVLIANLPLWLGPHFQISTLLFMSRRGLAAPSAEFLLLFFYITSSRSLSAHVSLFWTFWVALGVFVPICRLFLLRHFSSFNERNYASTLTQRSHSNVALMMSRFLSGGSPSVVLWCGERTLFVSRVVCACCSQLWLNISRPTLQLVTLFCHP